MLASFTAFAMPAAPPARAPVSFSPAYSGMRKGRKPPILVGIGRMRGDRTLLLPPACLTALRAPLRADLIASAPGVIDAFTPPTICLNVIFFFLEVLRCFADFIMLMPTLVLTFIVFVTPQAAVFSPRPASLARTRFQACSVRTLSAACLAMRVSRFFEYAISCSLQQDLYLGDHAPFALSILFPDHSIGSQVYAIQQTICL